MRIIDAWMQHPSAEFLRDPMFESLRRWSHGQLAGDEVPVEATVAAMDAAGVQAGMLCAWWGPRGPLITSDQVAAIVRRYPDRFAGVAAAWRESLRGVTIRHLADRVPRAVRERNRSKFGTSPRAGDPA
jgi:predicted TIM-barrel fold metal-dependent hydrolase